MKRLFAGLFVVGLPALWVTSPALASGWHGPERVVKAEALAGLIRPIPMAMPVAAGAEIAKAAPATVVLVQDQPRHRRHRHRRSRRHHREQASQAPVAAWRA